MFVEVTNLKRIPSRRTASFDQEFLRLVGASSKMANFPRVTARALMTKCFAPKTSVEPGNYSEKSNHVLAKCLSAPFMASELRGCLVVRRVIDLNRIDISVNHACLGRL
jgi:hypothetical protein